MSSNYAKFTLVDAMIWKLPSVLGLESGKRYLDSFKYAWIIHNKQNIKNAAASNRIPPFLLAGIPLREVGGKDFADWPVFFIRSFDWMGPSLVDKNMTVFKDPTFTSMGAASIQLRRAAQAMGLDPSTLTQDQLYYLGKALQSDEFNLNVVAKHLYQLILIDYPKILDTANLSDDQVRIVGTRYYYGPEASFEFIKQKAFQNESYGSRILQNKELLLKLLL